MGRKSIPIPYSVERYLALYGALLCGVAFLRERKAGGESFALPLGISGQVSLAAGAVWFAGVMNDGSFAHLLCWTLFVFAWTGAYLGAARLLNRPGFAYLSWLTLAFGILTAAFRESGIAPHSENILMALWLAGGAAFAWAYFRTASWTGKRVHSCAAALLLVWSYLNGLALFVRPQEAYFGLWMLPLWTGMFAAGLRAMPDDANRDQLLWQPMRRVAAVLSALTLALAVGMTDRWLYASEEARPALATLTLLAYGAAYGLLAAFRQTPRTIAACAVTLTLAYTHHLLTQTPVFGGTLSWPHFAFYAAQAGVFWLTLGWNVARRWQRPIQAKPLLVLAGAVALCCASAGVWAVQTPYEGRWTILTLAWCGAVWFGLWLLEQGEICLHVGAWNLLLGWMLIIYDRYGAGLDALDIHLLPVGLYLLMIGFREGRREHRDAAHFFWWAGLLLLMTPPFLGYWNHGAAWHTILLLVECVGAVLFGIGQRIRAFVCAGFLFAALFGAAHITGHLPEVWGTFAALLLGVGLFIAGFYALTHREIVQRCLTVGERQWKAWRQA